MVQVDLRGLVQCILYIGTSNSSVCPHPVTPSVPCTGSHTIARVATDKKLGFLDDLHVTWLSFHPDINFAQNPREDYYHKIYSVFSLEAYMFWQLSILIRLEISARIGSTLACLLSAQIVPLMSHTHSHIRQSACQFSHSPAGLVMYLYVYSAGSGASMRWTSFRKGPAWVQQQIIFTFRNLTIVVKPQNLGGFRKMRDLPSRMERRNCGYSIHF